MHKENPKIIQECWEQAFNGYSSGPFHGKKCIVSRVLSNLLLIWYASYFCVGDKILDHSMYMHKYFFSENITLSNCIHIFVKRYSKSFWLDVKDWLLKLVVGRNDR